MSAACSAMVRSLENFPELATFKIALRAHPSKSVYNSPSRWSASRFAHTRFGLAANMTSVVPQPDYWLRQVVFVAQRAQARWAQQEVSTDRGIEPEPTSGEYSQEMPARKKQHVTLNRAHAFHRAVCPRANLVRRFSSGAAIAKQLPIRALPVDVSGKATLILAIVPFEQVPIDFSHSSKASQLAGPGGTLQRAGKHLCESYSPRNRSSSRRALRSPRSVSGRSVSPVCWPER